MNSLTSANLSCLEQALEFLESLPEADYTRPCPELFNSSIGGHLRHNLDHYSSFLAAYRTGEVDYDARERDAAIERQPGAAAELIRRQIADFKALGEADLDHSLKIRMDDGGDSTWSTTSLRRELQFLLSHTIHHYALIVSIASRFGHKRFPRDFGIAPSTLHYHAGEGA